MNQKGRLINKAIVCERIMIAQMWCPYRASDLCYILYYHIIWNPFTYRNKINISIGARISDYDQVKQWDVIYHPNSNFKAV